MRNDIREYLGDGVYAEYNGCDILIYTSDGISKLNQIHIDHCTMHALERFLEKIKNIQNGYNTGTLIFGAGGSKKSGPCS